MNSINIPTNEDMPPEPNSPKRSRKTPSKQRRMRPTLSPKLTETVHTLQEDAESAGMGKIAPEKILAWGFDSERVRTKINKWREFDGIN